MENRKKRTRNKRTESMKEKREGSKGARGSQQVASTTGGDHNGCANITRDITECDSLVAAPSIHVIAATVTPKHVTMKRQRPLCDSPQVLILSL